jgi:hypothetical protein
MNFKIANTLLGLEDKLGASYIAALLAGATDGHSQGGGDGGGGGGGTFVSGEQQASPSAGSKTGLGGGMVGGKSSLRPPLGGSGVGGAGVGGSDSSNGWQVGQFGIDASLYALRRGCDRADTLRHVEALMALCNAEGENKLVAVKQMLCKYIMKECL